MTKGTKLYMEREKDLRRECDQMVVDGECDQDFADFRFSMVRDEILDGMDDALFEQDYPEPYFKNLDNHAEGTYNCDGKGGSCLYNQYGRCIYNIAPIQQRISRACYPELLECENEARLDYLDGCY